MPAPAIDAIVPSYGPIRGGTSVLIRGTGLNGVTGVKFGSADTNGTVIHSDTEMNVMTPPNPAGVAAVTVSGEGGTSNAKNFTYIEHRWAGDRRTVFLIEIGYLLLLLVLGVLYASWPLFKRAFSEDLAPIPIIIPWFAALGAVTISLTGVFRHPDDWDPSYFFWHVARPFMGIVLGSIAYLIFLGGILATGTTNVLPATPKNPIQGVSYDVIAFVAGYREEVLRTLIRRVVDLLLNPLGPTPDDTTSTKSRRRG